ncbi:hypothetical protein TWF281_007211 [Arthrobotrys megalospora]
MSNYADYTVGWICAIRTEYVAAQAFLDENFGTPESIPASDNNHYTLGRIGKHKIVIVVLPDGEYGLSSAAAVLKDMLRSFINIKIGLMVGIGGGAPSRKHDIRLGDVVVSSPCDGHGGVFQYDFGKTMQVQRFRTLVAKKNFGARKFQETGYLGPPPVFLRTAVSGLKARYELQGHQIEKTIESVLQKNKRLNRKYKRPGSNTDRLYRADVIHPPKGEEEKGCEHTCGDDASKLILRPERDEDEDNPAIHYGLIASANQLMKNAAVRNKLASEKGVLCFEMEAAGLMNQFPCLIIRGICDYSDSHKNKEWQGYASMTAAAYAKDLLNEIAPNKVEAETRIAEIPGILSSIEKMTTEIHTRIQDTEASVGHLTSKQRQADIKSWLSPPDYSTNYNKASQQHHKGSGNWFLESESFSKWKTERNSFLWLYGIMGCGKTILSSTIIENLSADRPLLYFYFDFTDGNKQTFDKMIRAIIYQLYYLYGKASSHLEALYHSCEDGQTQPSPSALLQTFLNMAEETEEICLVLDALDECNKEDRANLLAWMKGIRIALEHKNIHLLVTSRPENDIESGIKRLNCTDCALGIQSSLTANDIAAYIRWRVREDEGLERWQPFPDIQDEIETELQQRSNGMFRWVACQLDALNDCLDLRQLRQTLRSLPKTLNETYARILSGIPAVYKQNAIKILQFLTYSKRPLWIEEAIDAIAVDLAEIQHFHPKYRMPNQNEILCYCSSLVVSTNHPDGSRSSLQLAHYSVKEYLTSNRLGDDIAPYFREAQAKESMAKICLAYSLHLSITPEPNKGDNIEKGMEELRRKFPFAEYCARYWAKFAASAGTEDQILQGLMRKFFCDAKSAYLYCYHLYQPEKRSLLPEWTMVSGLYYASLNGIDSIVSFLVSNGADVNAQGGFCNNALQVASTYGHYKVVRTLLANGADINARGNLHGNALQAASYSGHANVVKLLLAHGANVNVPGGGLHNPLMAAVSSGYDNIVRLLLANGADTHGNGVLQVASASGHDDVVELLLDNGVDINAQHASYGTALQAASSRNRGKTVQLLLAKGANINARGTWGNALQVASSSGHIEVVGLLLANGADANQRGVLQTASSCGYTKIVELLLASGADVNAQSGIYNTALQAAANCGYEKTVKVLLASGANVNLQNEGSRASKNAIEAAVNRGHHKVVELLLDNGADVSGEGYYSRLIGVASSRGHDKVVELLLAKENVQAQC